MTYKEFENKIMDLRPHYTASPIKERNWVSVILRNSVRSTKRSCMRVSSVCG